MRTRLTGFGRGLKLRWLAVTLIASAAAFATVAPAGASAANRSVRSGTVRAMGELDCNGDSPVQQAVRRTMACTDIRGFAGKSNANNWNSRFYDNGVYVGHDEPDMTFLSNQAGSGDNVEWTETLPRDPAGKPTDKSPGSDVAHWFELSLAPWYSMAMCDSNSYPQLPCSAQSDSNAPKCFGPSGCTSGSYPGAGSAFMEMQFYPPGFAPFADSISCDNSHWCGALTIDSLECTLGFASCNTGCEEPINFGFIQTNGVPTGPPSPQEANLSTSTPNSHTLLMNPGDKITVRMFDAPVPGHSGTRAFEVVVKDLTTGKSGFMQASAANGFQNTSIADCSGTPYNFQPEYSTAAKQNITPWAALQTDISTEYETGHWESCSSLTDRGSNPLAPGITDTYWSTCHGPYEDSAPGGDGSGQPEQSDAFCYPAGDTHGALDTAPDTTTGCLDNFIQNGDLDFDGSPYWPEWPTGTAPTTTFPGSFVEQLPTTQGDQYARYFIQTDLALSESTCSTTHPVCAVPPPNAPGKFYPFWSRVTSSTGCTLEFGNVTSGAGVNDFGRDAQYGTDLITTLGYPEFEGPVMRNSCRT
jgi:hypothetical protein